MSISSVAEPAALFEHREPIAVLADDLTRLVRGEARRNPNNPLEAQGRTQCIRDVQMAVVNRIESSAEDPDAPRPRWARHNTPMGDFVATVAFRKSERNRSITWSSIRTP